MDTQSWRDPVEPLYDARVRGAAVIATAAGDRVHLHGGCWVSPCASAPARLMVAFPKEFEGAEIVRKGKAFSVSFAARDQTPWLEAFFAGDQAITRANQHLFFRSETGCPVLSESVAYLDCSLSDAIDLGDFLLAIGDVVSGGVLRAGAPNLTVNEMITAADPRGEKEAALPFHGFDFDLSCLPPAPGGPLRADDFEAIYAHRAWGLFFVSTAGEGRGHVHFGSWMMQTSHAPPRMAVAFKHTWEGTRWVKEGAPFAMTLVSSDQIPQVRRVAAGEGAGALSGDLEQVDGGLFRLKEGVAWFRCTPSSLHEVGDFTLAVGGVDAWDWIRKEATNMTDQEARGAVGGPWCGSDAGFDLKAIR